MEFTKKANRFFHNIFKNMFRNHVCHVQSNQGAFCHETIGVIVEIILYLDCYAIIEMLLLYLKQEKFFRQYVYTAERVFGLPTWY